MLKGSWISLAMCLSLGSHGQTLAPLPTHQVWIPALVESKAGKIAYVLSVDDFSIKDNGVERQCALQSDLGTQPISLLFVIRTAVVGSSKPAGMISSISGNQRLVQISGRYSF